MGNINTVYAFDQALCIFQVTGEVHPEDLMQRMHPVESANRSFMHMWDFSRGALAFQLNEGARFLHQEAKAHPPGPSLRTALVCPNELDHGLFRILQIFGRTKRFPQDVRLFRQMRAAQRWLGACSLCPPGPADKPGLSCVGQCTRRHQN